MRRVRGRRLAVGCCYALLAAAAGKGCFPGSAPVTLHDGSRRPLAGLRPGDLVASWDEERQIPAVSEVRAVPTFLRDPDDLVELELPNATLLATEDHPLWSRSRRSVVSLRPEATHREYGLPAELLQAGEELEGEAGHAVRVAGVRRPGAALLQSLQADPSVARQLRARKLEVQTLCLEPHHWFYVEGVRVHNKGCFAPWTPVLLEEPGRSRQIQQVRPGDRVLSWDDALGKPAAATVLAVEVHPAPETLVEIALEPEDGEAVGASASETIVVTEDHPFYSKRVGGLVSVDPEGTAKSYGLPASRMSSPELLEHHSGRALAAEVRRWNGTAPGEVMTLRLEEHHWFYAQGVRVHNKGGGGGGRGGSGGSHGFFGESSSRPLTRSSFDNAHAFAMYTVMHAGSRRRYGTYLAEVDDGECILRNESSVMQSCTLNIATSATDQDVNYTDSLGFIDDCRRTTRCCYDCLACTDGVCVDRIAGCDTFLADAFEECVPPVEDALKPVITALILFGIFFVCPCFFIGLFKTCQWLARFCSSCWPSPELRSRRALRCQMKAMNNGLPASLEASGTYTENNESKPCAYQFWFAEDGRVTGTGRDDDGTAVIDGKVQYASRGEQGLIAWLETRQGVQIEIRGTISDLPGGGFVISASYISSYQGTRGALELWSSGAVQ